MPSDYEEFLRLEKARKIILEILNEKGREGLYDLSGLSGGFLITEEDKNLLNTYIGASYFAEKVDEYGLKHLGGDEDDKCVAFNRTSSAILATILALKPKKVVHYLPELPGHPSIERSCKITNAEYFESDNIEEILNKIDKDSLVVITGSTMDLKVVELENFKKVIDEAKNKGAIVFVDDASGARVRLLFNQPPALKLGADLVVTSTDKLMEGPRGGLLAGKKELVDKIYIEGTKFGLEAQPPLLAGIYRALENFNLERVKKAFERAKNFDLSKIEQLNKELKKVDTNIEIVYEKTPTGFAIKRVYKNDEVNIKKLVEIGFNLLKNFGIITITVAGMPGASKSLRIDLTSKDAERISDDYIIKAITESIKSVFCQP
ncbi:TIGR03576 family pyridoxal phosphate-dependent enzyme [Methanocaldococcus fervens]|uniref:Pyridoxal phosphate enzyme n=1 Tax=Methanocaldococcus fervens (strain DSM 4213 / JCM 15782 / AG86) TaxID=573064 RepID=C7P655_METFA|nr:TIGR03576 family pyridoxal phosphate-dependent enzyme [Methanocaldococcus fervens]ACV24037.1 pyridoxal phosphate enzyme [Methanocaldococcus fervens AG86]